MKRQKYRRKKSLSRILFFLLKIDNEIRSADDDDGNDDDDDDDGRARSGRLGRRVYSVIIETVEIDGEVKSIDGSGGYVYYNRTCFLPRNSYVAEQFRKPR